MCTKVAKCHLREIVAQGFVRGTLVGENDTFDLRYTQNFYIDCYKKRLSVFYLEKCEVILDLQS